MEVHEDFACVLNQSSIGIILNKFFVIQVLTDGSKYYEFARWGRVGDIGQNKLSLFNSKEAAEQAFKKRYELSHH